MPVGPGTDIQKAIDANSTGTSFCIQSGDYRLTTGLVPKDRDQFVGEVGAALNGSQVLTTWSESGTRWTHAGDTRNPGSLVGDCEDGTNACAYPDDVYLDNARLTRVLSLSDLAPGKVYIDYGENKVYLADDPTNHTIELASATQAFTDTASNVVVKDLVVEKFANMASIDDDACLDMGSGWIVDGVEIRYCHGIGVSGGDNSILRNSRVHDVGQLGLSGNGETGSIFEYNEVDHNNTAGYDWGWSGGGSKWWATTDLVVRGNYVHDNAGPGLWTDTNNHNTTYDGNTVVNNEGSGIFHELSYEVTVTNNVVSGNGTDWGQSQIDFTDSGGNVSIVSGNTVVVANLGGHVGGIVLTQDNRGNTTQNVTVSSNSITMCENVSGASGSGVSAHNNRFANNSYYVKSLSGEFWQWNGDGQTWSGWQAAGNDVDGSAFTASC